MDSNHFEFLLFSTEPTFIQQADKAGIDGFIVDWERLDKYSRQKGFDTQINKDTLQDLERVRHSTAKTVLCRINGFHQNTTNEIDLAISAGADEIFLPMVRSPEEVARTLDIIKGRCQLSILIETQEAVNNAAALTAFPLRRIYLGMNDLAIDRGLKNIFISIIDGTVESVRTQINLPCGFAGLTLPELGSPIPCRLLTAEMARLNCQFTFLRRSFIKDIAGKDMQHEVPRMRQALQAAHQRSSREIHSDQKELTALVSQWDAVSLPQ